jgi:TIR domain
MPKRIRRLIIWLFLFTHQLVHAQAPAYESQPSSPDTFTGSHLSPFVYIIVIAIVAVIGVVLYKLYSSRNKETAHYLENQPRIEPVQGPTSVPRPAAATGSIFISYRRDDSADITGRIYDRLVQHFSRDIVFKDVDSIPLGIDFRQHLEGALSQCRVLLAVMGERWSGTDAATATRRIDDPSDHVRIELELALARNIPVIPVLVRSFSIPAPDKLPQSLQSLAYRNGINVRPDPDFHGDMDRLIKGIGSHLTR